MNLLYFFPGTDLAFSKAMNFFSKTCIWFVSILVAATFLIGWFRLGVYQEREFDDYYLFVKHRFSSHFYFHSPVGESDLRLSSLTESDCESELLYKEFVEDRGGWERAVYLPL